MTANSRFGRRLLAAGGIATMILACCVFQPASNGLEASPLCKSRSCRAGKDGACGCESGQFVDDIEGTWYWLRSPEEEKRVVMSLYNRYCIRCHGVDGRGVWDIPDVPDFTNARWQATRSDSQLARSILEGRGAVMPLFRGSLSLEESWGMARYLRTFVPGTEASKPDTSKTEAPKVEPAKPAASKPAIHDATAQRR
jgi:hypothetical protein